jgi:hypothetical protein
VSRGRIISEKRISEKTKIVVVEFEILYCLLRKEIENYNEKPEVILVIITAEI